MNSKLLSEVKNSFKKCFSSNPLMVFSPGRINLIGEHTDYNEGFVFPAAIDKGIYLGIQQSVDNECKAFALDKGQMYTFNLSNIKPLKNGWWRNYVIGVVAEIQKLGIELQNFNVAFAGDLPTGAGMSSSAALENSIVFGLNELFKLGLTKSQMILISQKSEHNFAGVKCGIMDQYASMFGEKGSALLLDCRTNTSKAFKINFKEYQLLLINTNVKHNLSDSVYNERRNVCEKISEILKIDALRDASKKDLNQIKSKISQQEFDKALYVVEENIRIRLFSKAIQEDEVKTLGKLLFNSHNGLSTQYKVSCRELDFLVDLAKENSAVLGARMMGGGFGGCTINLIDKKKVKQFKEYVFNRYQKEFKHTCSFYEVKLSEGTRLI